MSTHCRPVWLTREQRDWLANTRYPHADKARAITDAWDAAPADPAQAIGKWIEWEANIPAVLRALGIPDDHEPPLGARCN